MKTVKSQEETQVEAGGNAGLGARLAGLRDR